MIGPSYRDKKGHTNMPQPTRKKTGITHFPLVAEQGSQERVPPRGKTKEVSGPATASGTRRGHRLSRRKGSAMASGSNEGFTAKGVKGGKSGGSRAGLLSSRKPSKGKR
jgi:hypothetical protein